MNNFLLEKSNSSLNEQFGILGYSKEKTPTKYKCNSHSLAPWEDLATTTIGAMTAILGLTGQAKFAIIIASSASPFVYVTTSSMYSEAASLPQGADLLGLSDVDEDLAIQIQLMTPYQLSKCYLKDFGMWIVALEKGIMYAYGLNVFLGNSYLGLTGSIVGGYINMYSELRGGLGKWSAQRQAAGEPGYDNTVSWFLDPIPLVSGFLPKWVNNKINPAPFLAKFYPSFRAFVHIIAVADAFKKLLGMSTVTSMALSWLLPFGGSEYVYVSSYAAKLIGYILNKAGKSQPEGLSWLLVALHDRLSWLLYAMNGRFTSALWGIIIDPVRLYKGGKIAGSAIMGTAAAIELNEQIPALTKIIADQLFDKEIDFEIPSPIYYTMMVVFTVALAVVGNTQVKAAEDKTLAGEQIDFSKQILQEFGLKPEVDKTQAWGRDDKQDEKPQPGCTDRVKQRFNGVIKIVVDNIRPYCCFFRTSNNPIQQSSPHITQAIDSRPST